MTEETPPPLLHIGDPIPKIAAKPKAKPKASPKPKKKPASRPSSKRASAPKPKPRRSTGHKSKAKAKKPPGRKRSGKTPGHWSKTHAQLVIHAMPELVAKLDRAISRLGKKLKLDRPTRGSVVRALVQAALK